MTKILLFFSFQHLHQSFHPRSCPSLEKKIFLIICGFTPLYFGYMLEELVKSRKSRSERCNFTHKKKIGSGKYHQVVIKHDCGSLNSEPTKNQVGA